MQGYQLIIIKAFEVDGLNVRALSTVAGACARACAGVCVRACTEVCTR